MDEERAKWAERIHLALGEMFKVSRMPALVLRSTGEILAANRAATAKYGYEEEEWLTMRIHDLVMDDRDVDGEIKACFAGGDVVLTRRPHRKKDGGILSVLPSAFPMDAGGEICLVSLLQDVTSLDAAEAAAKKAREETRVLEAEAMTHKAQSNALRAELLAESRLATIGRLAAGVAHEVNNPATLVMLNLESLKKRLTSADPRTGEALAMLDDCLEAMGRIRDIVSDVKGVAVNRGSEQVDLSLLAAGVIRMTKLGADLGANVDVSLEPNVYARVRGSRLTQVVTNLLLNAVEATPESAPQIRLRTFRAGNEACIEVSDRGPGVPDHLAERIFEPFFTTRAGSGGTGLGLWLARGIVEEEGGRIALSNGPRGGAVFRVSLPAADGG